MSNTPAKKKKRFKVAVGDLVMFHTCEQHMFGTLGEVTHVLGKNQVVAKCLSSGNANFTEVGMHITLLTYEPQGMTRDGDSKSYYANYITKVIHRAKPKPPKPPKKVLPPRVLTTTEELIEHLAAGDVKERVIVAPTVVEKTS